MADIFKEIDEELRHDRMVRLWQRHGRLIIALAAAAVVAMAGFVASAASLISIGNWINP